MKIFYIILLSLTTHLGAQPTIDIDADNDGLIEVNNLEILDAMRYQLDGSGLRINATAEKVTTGCAVGGCKGYELTRDLDFLDTSSYKDIGNQKRWTNGAGWQPIGDSENPFTAIFKTNNSSTPNTIFNLMISRSDEDNVGLFGRLGHAAQLSGIGLLDIQVTGRHRVGGLVGENVGGQISNSYASGRVTGNGGTIGLLVGSNRGAITNSYADGEVSGKANSVGGLVGMNSGNISNSYAMGSVAGSANNVGGLVGDNSQGVISNSYASSHVSGSEDIGGLVGLSNLGTLIKNYVSGKASGIRYVGGLVGMNIGGTISHSYWDKTTSALNSDTGGVGLSASELQSASAQSEDLKKPFYQWITAHWDFGNEAQYPILKYATGADADNPACGPGPSLPNCGSLLLGQHANLKNIVLLADATLTPKFKPTRFNYHLNITPATKQLQIIPIATNPNVVIDINKNGTAIETDLASGTTSTTLTLEQNTQLTIAVSAANQRPAQYQLTVNYLPEITVTGIPQYALDEGRRIMLSASNSDADEDVLSYRWQQSLGKALAFDATDQPILVLRIPEDYVSVHASGAELELTLAVSDGKANISQAIRIDINKIDNGTITVAAPTSGVVEWTAPEVKLADDPDGVGNNLQYQWQSRAPDQSSDWIDIAQATQRNYTPSILTAVGTEYRVRLSYTDGQGYATTVHSKAAPYEPEIVKLDFVRGQAMPPTPTPAQTTTATSESDCDTANLDQITDIDEDTDIDKDDDGLIEICNLEGLDAMRYQLDGSGYRASADAAKITTGCAPSGCSGYELMRDLDFLDDASYRNTDNKNIWLNNDDVYITYRGWVSIGDDVDSFDATFEGNNHIISNLMINGAARVGLFGYGKSKTKIMNVGLSNVDIKGGTWVGGLVGYLKGGRIINSYVAGTVTGSRSIGGLVGHLMNGRITNSYMVGTMVVAGVFDHKGGLVGYSSNSQISNSYMEGTITGAGTYTGGLVGYLHGGRVENSYMTSSVRGDENVGGLVGYLKGGRIINSYVASMVKGNSSVGGLVAAAGSRPTITNSYWDTTVSGIRGGNHGIGLTTEQLLSPTAPDATNPARYTRWGIKDWDFGTSQEYPILKYAKGSDSNKPTCREATTMSSVLPVCGTLLSPAIRYGLKDLRLAEGALWPEFVGSLAHYSGTAASSTSLVRLIPTALNPTAKIMIEAYDDSTNDDIRMNEILISATTSNAILLKSNKATRIDLTVINGGETTRTVLYKLYLMYHHHGEDIDIDNDGLIEINHLEDLNAIRYQLDGSGYRSGSRAPKITLGCPDNGCIGYELAKDLDFWDDESYKYNKNQQIWTGKHSWRPIGDDKHHFTGVFDGNDHMISNLKVHKPSSGNLGLFGVTGSTAEISNIELVNVDITGDSAMGGLVGKNHGKITNSRTTGKISAAVGYRYNSGGLVGYNTGLVMNSYSTIRVIGRASAGGLVGGNAGEIINGYAMGNIAGSFRVGGLVGHNIGRGRIMNSYALGEVSGGGGLVGLNEGGGVSASYWDTDTSGKMTSNGGEGKTTQQLQEPTTATGIYASWSTANWDFGNESRYPVLRYGRGMNVRHATCQERSSAGTQKVCGEVIQTRGLPGLKELKLVNGNLFPEFVATTLKYKGKVVNSGLDIRLIPTALDAANKISIELNDEYIDEALASGTTSSVINLRKNSANTIILTVMTDRGSIEYELNLSYYEHTGDIDEDDDGLIEIKNFDELNDIRHQLDGTGYRADSISPKITEGCPVAGCRGYELMNDLDFAEPGGYAVDPEKGWRPIGVTGNGFQAIFEGNGHTISNVRINRSQTSHVGLFGYIVGKGVIRNLGMLNVNIHGYARVGSLAGEIFSGGRVINSYAIGRVTGKKGRIGGLVGSHIGARIINSYANVDVEGVERSIGGLIGLSADSDITNSYATGTVEGLNRVGGLVGYADEYKKGSIENSYAIGSVSGRHSEVGGLIGDRIVSGITRGKGVVFSYWDKKTSGKTSSDGGTGKMTQQLQEPTTATGIYAYWSTANWDFGTTSQYPAIKYAEHCGAPSQPVCGTCGAPQQPVCGTLLPNQYLSLLNDLSVNGTLSPKFNPATLSYDVTVKFDVDNLILRTTATNASIRITSSFAPTVINSTATASAEIPLTITGPTIITIEVSSSASRSTTHYQLSVLHDEGNPERDDLTAQGRVGDGAKKELPIKEIRVSEGQTFEVSFEGECKSVCGWEVPDELASLLENEQHSTDNLIFREVPADFVGLGNTTGELKLEFTTRQNSDGYAGNKKNSITVIILKTDNGDISVERPALNGRSMTAPDIAGDPDRGVQADGITYQWQQAKADNLDLGKDASWENIAGATAKSYTVPESIAYSLSYRVRISYTDGQGYGETVNSQPIRDIDADDDGLIEIKYLEELDAIRHQLDGSGYRANSSAAKATEGCPANQCIGYELVADLDFNDDASYSSTSNKVVWTEGAGWVPIGDIKNAFSSMFKGNGHTISNLRINRGAIDNVGLFYEIGSRAKIDSIDLYRVRITGHDNVGSLVGFNLGGRITNSNVSDVEVIGNGDNIGGLVGFNLGIVSQSYASVDVKGINENMGSYVGGLVGDNHGSIINSYATGTVNGIAVIGGLAGRNIGGSIENSYARATASRAQSAVGLVGFNYGIITSSYWETRDNFVSSNNDGIGLSTEALQSPTTATGIYSAWDVAVWDFGTENQYPALKYHRGECTQANPPNDCGTLLPGQRVGLQSLKLSQGAMLLSNFSPDTYTYNALAAGGERLALVLAAAHPQAMIRIINDDADAIELSGNDEQIVELGSEVKATTIHVIVNKRQSSYTLTVSRYDVKVTMNGEEITDVMLNEGDSPTLEASVEYERSYSNPADIYSWMHEQPRSLLTSTTRTGKQITFNISTTYVEAGESITTPITLKVMLRQGDNSLTYNKEINLTIHKRDNGPIDAASIKEAIEHLISDDSLLSVHTEVLPVAVLMEDPDGVNQNPAINYQWQRLIASGWETVSETSVTSAYKVPVSVISGSEYRVLISYTDGQGYESTTASGSITFIDIDRDNDGLIEVHSAAQLNAIRYQLDGSGLRMSATTASISIGCADSGCKGYELQAHIDLSKYSNWQPLGSEAEPFNAILEGNRRPISNLRITTATNYVGLFAFTGESAEIRNIGLLNAAITANDNVGGIVGYNEGTVNSSHSSHVDITANDNVGGIVGYNEGTVNSSHSSNVDITANDNVGGIVGYNEGTVNSSHSSNVDITANDNVGGITGHNEGTVNSSYVDDKSIVGQSNVGALIGFNEGDVIGVNYAIMESLQEGGSSICKLIGGGMITIKINELLGGCSDN